MVCVYVLRVLWVRPSAYALVHYTHTDGPCFAPAGLQKRALDMLRQQPL